MTLRLVPRTLPGIAFRAEVPLAADLPRMDVAAFVGFCQRGVCGPECVLPLLLFGDDRGPADAAAAQFDGRLKFFGRRVQGVQLLRQILGLELQPAAGLPVD